jgi:hypothetical protein
MNEYLIGDRSPGVASDSGGASSDVRIGADDPPRRGSYVAVEGTPEVPPDLAPAALPLEPCFPLEARGTSIVLAGDRAGHLRAFWHLDRDDFEYAAASFPTAGVRPVAVIRLRRGRWGDNGETVAERALSPDVRNGAGEVPFEAPRDHSRYHAELGLSTPQGGWLMLTRSNRLYNADGVGLDLPDRPETETPDGQALHGPVSVDGAEVDPILLQSSGQPAPVALAFPLVMPAREWRRAYAAAPEAHLGAGARAELVWPSSHVEPALALDSGAVAAVGDGSLGVCAPVQHQIDALATLAAVIAHAPVETRGVDHTLGGSAMDRARTAPSGTGQAGTDLGPRPDEPGVGSGAIAPLTYGSPPARPSPLRIEAELRIMGSASPNQTLNLFGFPYRVGPGGRFQFVLPVDDPELLARALAERPPRALLKPKD